MQQGNLKKLLLQLFILALPLLCILLSFFAFDPYGFFLPLESKSKALIPISDDYIAVERYLAYTPQKHYNSFTFGNSKTLAYLTSDWSAHLKNASPYKFGVPGECIFNILNKLKLIDSKGDSIKNVLLIFDSKVFVNFKNSQKFFQGPAYLHHPYSTNGSWMEFYSSYLKYYFTDFAFLKVAKFKLTGNYEASMEEFFKNPEDYTATYAALQLLPFTNEVINTAAEKELNEDSSAYFNRNSTKFSSRAELQKESQPWEIKKEDLEFMQEMMHIFKKHNCNYKVILGPNFDQIPFPTKQKNQLIQIFGSGAMYDFTGVNQYTNSISHYYEKSHYRIGIGKAIMDEIYR